MCPVELSFLVIYVSILSMYRSKCLYCNSKTILSDTGFRCPNLLCVAQQSDIEIASEPSIGTPLHYIIDRDTNVDVRAPEGLSIDDQVAATTKGSVRKPAPAFVRAAEGILPVSLRPPRQKDKMPYRATLHIPYTANREAHLMTPNVTLNRQYVRDLMPTEVTQRYERISLTMASPPPLQHSYMTAPRGHEDYHREDWAEVGIAQMEGMRCSCVTHMPGATTLHGHIATTDVRAILNMPHF
jgi:hypothetical protein